MTDQSIWHEFSEDYEEKVFSLTKSPKRRQAIIDVTVGPDVLNLGTGPTRWMNADLLRAGFDVTASDWSMHMIKAGRISCVNYVVADHKRLPFEAGEFNSVLALNTILPPDRTRVQLILQEARRVLGPGGVLVAFLPSYESVVEINDYYGAGIRVDHGERRVWDTTGWQCFHTMRTILKEVKPHFSTVHADQHFLDHPEDIESVKKAYGIDTTERPIWEYFLKAYV